MIRNRLVLKYVQCGVLLMAVVWPLVVTAHPQDLPAIVVLSEVPVAGPKVYLGNLLTAESRSVLPEIAQLDTAFIASAPAPGQTKVLEGREVSGQLEALGITRVRYGISVPDRIVLQRQGQTLTPEDISKQIEARFLPQLPWEDVRLEEIGINENVVLPSGLLELTFQQSPNTDLARPFYLNINFWINGQIVKRSFVRTVLAISHSVAIADRDFDPSDKIPAGDVRWERRRLSSTLHAPVSRAEFFDSRKPRFKIAAGQTMTEDMFVVVPLIKRGDDVVLVFEDKTIHITTKGLSLTAGSRGDQIRVMNPTSRKEMTAEIIDERTVRVIF